MNPDMPNMGAMKIVMFVMPVFSVWLAFSVPAGVGFYWIWSSVFSFLQSFLLYAYFSPKRIEAINVKLKEKNKNKKPGLMQRMMDQQAEMLKQQEQAKKADGQIITLKQRECPNLREINITESLLTKQESVWLKNTAMNTEKTTASKYGR